MEKITLKIIRLLSEIWFKIWNNDLDWIIPLLMGSFLTMFLEKKTKIKRSLKTKIDCTLNGRGEVRTPNGVPKSVFSFPVVSIHLYWWYLPNKKRLMWGMHATHYISKGVCHAPHRKVHAKRSLNLGRINETVDGVPTANSPPVCGWNVSTVYGVSSLTPHLRVNKWW